MKVVIQPKIINNEFVYDIFDLENVLMKFYTSQTTTIGDINCDTLSI